MQVDTWFHGFVEGFIAFPVLYFVMKVYGSALEADIMSIFTKKTTTPVVGATGATGSTGPTGVVVL